MPIYEYRCTACGHELEALQKITEPPLSSCPECRTDTLTKLVSAAGFQLKGSGWYVTDFRDGGKSGGDKTSVSSPSDGASAKPAEAPASAPAPAPAPAAAPSAPSSD